MLGGCLRIDPLAGEGTGYHIRTHLMHIIEV